MPTLQLAIDARGSAAGAAKHTAATRRVQRSSVAAARGVTRLDARMTALGRTGALLSRTFVGIFGALAGIAAFRAATKTIAGFEQTMATVLGVTRASAEEFENLTEVARRLGATTRFTAREAGEGLLFLARAGFTTEEAIAAVPATLNLAQAGMLDLGEAADFASNILRQFSLDAEETVRVVDTLVITANRSNTNVRQLAEAMKFAGPIAGALGITVEETAAAIGALGDAGIQASLAGTSLRGIMLALLGPTGKAKKALEGMGITLDEVNPNLVGIAGAFERLAKANFTAEDALAIFNRRQAGAALILVRSTDAIERLTQANKEFAGEAERVARIMDDTLIGAFFNLRSAIEEVFLRAGEAGLTRVLRNLVDTVTGVIRVFNGMADSLGENRARFERLAQRVRQVVVFLGTLVAIRAIPFFIGLARAIIGATAAMVGLNVAVATNPLGFLATVIAGVITALFTYGDTLITIRGTTATVFDFIIATWEVVVETIKVGQGVINEAVLRGWEIIIAAVRMTNALIINAWKKVQDVHRLGSKLISDAVSRAWKIIADRAKVATDFIINVWRKLFSLLPPLTKKLVAVVGEFWGLIFARFKVLTVDLGVAWDDVMTLMSIGTENFVNNSIALFVSLIQTLIDLQARLIVAARAIAAFDVSRPKVSVLELVATFREQLSPEKIFAGITATFQRNFSRDFVGELKGFGLKFADVINRELENAFSLVSTGFELFFSKIFQRADALRRERERLQFEVDVAAAIEIASKAATAGFAEIDRIAAAAFDAARVADIEDLPLDRGVRRVEPTLAGAEEVSERFTGLATQFLSQQEPLLLVAQNTKRLVELAEEEATARKVLANSPFKANIVPGG